MALNIPSSKFQDIQKESNDIKYSEEDERAQVLKTTMTWDSYGEAYITRDQLHLIKKYDRKMADKVELLQQHGAEIAHILVVFLAKLSKDDDIRYVVTLIDDMINMRKTNPEVPNTLDMFISLTKVPAVDGSWKLPFGPFLTLINRKKHDPYILGKAITALTSLIVHASHVDSETIEMAMQWFLEQLRMDSREDEYDRKLSVTLNGLRIMLSRNKYRHIFVKEGGLPHLIRVSFFDNVLNFQRLYESGYCLWLLSFNDDAKKHMTDPKMIHNMCHISKRVQKEKVIRIALAALRNLIGVGKNNELMISYGLPKTVENLRTKKWGDEDIEKDLEELHKALADGVDQLSSWTQYYNELQSRKLEWSPSHKSDRFWTENFMRFEDNDYKPLKILQEILSQRATDKKILAIACYDIGQFTRFHPRGRHIIQQLDVKTQMMKLLTGNEVDEDVRKEALTALQKLMVQNWEYLQ